MNKISEILKRSELSNLLSYLAYGSTSIGIFGRNHDKALQESYSTFFDKLEQKYLEADRNDKYLSSAIHEFAQIHEDIYFEIGLKVGIQISEELHQGLSQQISEESKSLDSESILSSIAEFRMDTALEEILRKDKQYQQSCQEVKKTIQKLQSIGLDKEQWYDVDNALSAGNERSCEYGRVAYFCGFKDAISLLKDITKSI